MNAFAQATVNGLLQGGLLALVAIGFSLVWGVLNVVNLAHGAFVVLGAYVAWELHATWSVDPLIGMLAAAVVLFGLGYALQRGLINLIVNAPIFLTLLLTFGVDLLLVQGMNIRFTANYRSIVTDYSGSSIAVGAVRIPEAQLIAFGVALVMTFVLVALVNRTPTGRSIKATGMDRGAARLMGIRVRNVYALTFGLAAALAGLAGGMVGTIGTFQPADAARYTLLSFVIAVLGGLGNMYGALVGGLAVGLIESWMGQLLSGSWTNAVAFAVLIVVLVVRPAGLVGRQYYAARVEV